MITHAKIVKLNRHMSDDNFVSIINHIEAITLDGATSFDLEVDLLDDEMRLDLLDALESMGYDTIYDNESQTFEVSID